MRRREFITLLGGATATAARHTEPTLMTRLYTFTISHFAEKARWSLDYKGIHYQEKRLVPGLHVPIIKRIAPSTFVPVLQDAGCIIQGSSAIIDYVEEHSPEPPLTPADPSERQRTLELERWLDCEFGERVRRVFYFHALNHRDLGHPPIQPRRTLVGPTVLSRWVPHDRQSHSPDVRNHGGERGARHGSRDRRLRAPR